MIPLKTLEIVFIFKQIASEPVVRNTRNAGEEHLVRKHTDRRTIFWHIEFEQIMLVLSVSKAVRVKFVFTQHRHERVILSVYV